MRRSLAVLSVLVMGFAAGQAAAAGNAAKGAIVFHRCAICHSAEKGGGNGLGPNLWGVVGRKAGSLPGFPYSGVLKHSGIIWTNANLKRWVMGPQKMEPGTRMAFPGLTRAADADDLVAYLDTRK